MSFYNPINPHAPLHGDALAAFAPEVLPDRRELALIAVERTRMPMIISNPRAPDNPIILANEAFLKQTGYPFEEVIGRNCRFLQGPDTDPADIAAIREGLSSGEDFIIELRNFRKDGTAFWNQLKVSPIYDNSGDLLYYFASQMDVTKRREAQDLKLAEHRLLREVDHRAQNALALVQGIVRLTRADDTETYKEGVQRRVDALARAHSVLSAGRWSDVPLERLIRAEFEPFGVARTKIAGPEIKVRPQRVQPLALLLHELIANAAQHGALSVAEGAVAVSWRQEEGCTVLTMTEAGGPPITPELKQGFGLTMADAIARRQLGGGLKLEPKPDGLESRLTFVH